jgi:hypothetical protein
LRAISTNHVKNDAIIDRCIADMAVTKLTGGVAGQLLARTVDGWAAVTPAGGLVYDSVSGLFKVASPATAATFGDLKSRGSNGGNSIANTWVTRDLGEIEDGRELMVFTGNTFKLALGEYFFFARCPVSGAVGKHQARLFRDNGDTTNVIPLWGTSEINAAGQAGTSVVQGTLLVESTAHSFKLEHWCENAVASVGLGQPASSSNTVAYGNHSELYTSGYVLRLG